MRILVNDGKTKRFCSGEFAEVGFVNFNYGPLRASLGVKSFLSAYTIADLSIEKNVFLECLGRMLAADEKSTRCGKCERCCFKFEDECFHVENLLIF